MDIKQMLRNCVAVLVLLTTPVVAAQPVPPLTTEWESGLILQNGARPPAAYWTLATDSDAERTVVAVWNRVAGGPGGTSYNISQYARSTNQGRTWSEPKELLPNPEQEEPLFRNVDTVAAGKEGVWLAAVTTADASLTTFSCGVVISTDSGLTWGDFQDLTDHVQLEENRFAVDVAYCGDSTWIFLISTEFSVRYIRSQDNGETWGPMTLLGDADDYSGAVTGHPKGNAVMLTHYDADAGYTVSRFSVDHGATFGNPVRATMGATDGGNNWVVTSPTYAPVPIPLMHSTDNGATFTPIPSPPEIDDKHVNPYSVAYSQSGEIVLLAYAATCIGLDRICFDFQSGLVTRTSDLGQTWTPWERFGPNVTNTVNPVAVTATPNNNFFAIMNSDPAPTGGELHSFRLDLEPIDGPAAARDWQFYE